MLESEVLVVVGSPHCHLSSLLIFIAILSYLRVCLLAYCDLLKSKGKLLETYTFFLRSTDFPNPVYFCKGQLCP